MVSDHSSQLPNIPSPQDKIEAIVDSVVSSIDEFDERKQRRIEQDHPDLMPELRQRLEDCLIFTRAKLAAAVSIQASESNDADLPLDNYQILELIDTGGQGTVYRAIQKSPHRVVAIKIYHDHLGVDERTSLRMMREANVTARLNHPSIVKIIEAGCVEDRFYHVMEYIDGISITDYVLLEDLDFEKRIQLFARVIDAVSYAHRSGIIHRDLKPSNILVNSDACPFILDFGLAKILDATAPDHGSPQSIMGMVLGTVPYISPEQATGVDEVDARCDVYSLGIILGELITGAIPFSLEGSRNDIRRRILDDRPLSLFAMANATQPGSVRSNMIDAALDAVFRRAIERHPDDRYQSASAFADDVKKYLSGDVVSVLSDRASYVLKKLVRKYRAHVALASAAVVLLIVTAVLSTMFWIRSEQSATRARAAATVAQNVLSNVVTEIDEELRTLPGGTELRDRLLAGVESNLVQLEPLVDSGTKLSPIFAAQLENRGRIARAQGRRLDASTYFKKARHLLAQSNDGNQLLKDANLQRFIALVDDNPLPSLLHLANTLKGFAADSQSTALSEMLGLVHLDCARAFYYNDDYARCAEQAAMAVNELRPLSLASPESLSLRSHIAKALELKGTSQLHLMGPAAAGDSLPESLAIRKKLLTIRPYDVRINHALMMSHMYVGDQLALGGSVKLATEELQEAIRIGENLVRVEPTIHSWRHDLVVVRIRLVNNLLKNHALSEAEAQANRAVAMSEDLLHENALDLESRRIHASAIACRGRYWKATGNLKNALEDFQSAHALRSRIFETHPENPRSVDELAFSFEYLGKCYRQLGRLDESITHLMNSFELRKTAYTARNSTSINRLELVRAGVNLSSSLVRRAKGSDLELAREVLSEGRAHLNQVSYSQEDLAQSERFRGLCVAVDKNMKALEHKLLAISVTQ